MSQAVGTSYTKMQTARASVRQTRATQLAQAAERETRIEKAATAAVLAWAARQRVAQRLGAADEHVSAQLESLLVEKLSAKEIATLTGIPLHNCRLLIRELRHVAATTGERQDYTAKNGDPKVGIEDNGRAADAEVGVE